MVVHLCLLIDKMIIMMNVNLYFSLVFMDYFQSNFINDFINMIQYDFNKDRF
jgi:hypothetical protein